MQVDPKNADAIYVANTSTYRSTDGGQTFTAIKGAPGGDDYHAIWINPDNPEIILIGSDQGATITVNGGRDLELLVQPADRAVLSTSITDNRFPYWVYGGQQESGSAGVASRGNDGEITFRDWHPVGVEEYGYVAPDPLHPNIIYGGKVTRFDETHRPGAGCRPDRAAQRCVSLRADGAGHLLAGRSARALLRGATCCSRRPTADAVGRRSVPTSRADPGVPATSGVYAQRAAAARAPRRDLLDRARRRAT